MKKIVTLNRDFLETIYEHTILSNQFPIIIRQNDTDYFHYSIYNGCVKYLKLIYEK
jgi:hypothetical protein